MKARLIPLLAMAALATGCAQKPAQMTMTESDPAVRTLNEAAMRVARASEQAALAISANTRRSGVTQDFQIDLNRVPPEMRQPLLLERGFNGDLEAFLRSIADAVGWPAPVFLGTAPSSPVIVSFTEQRRPPILWIADAGYQVGAQADVTVNSSLRQIVVRYRDVRSAH